MPRLGMVTIKPSSAQAAQSLAYGRSARMKRLTDFVFPDTACPGNSSRDRIADFRAK